jgi:ParB family transcriptional regulator, chromosome partitioning protein
MSVALKKTGLGRGLDALIGAATGTTAIAAEPAGTLVKNLPVDLVQRGRYQPRIDIKPESLQELADSIKAQGVVQPIVVRPLAGSGRYEIIAGERRWRASQLAGLHEIPAIVRDVPDRTAMSIALIENIQREDLNPLEEALALHRLVTEFELTHQQVSEAVGRSRAAVTNLLRLLDLADPVKRQLEQGEIEMGHARALLALPADLQAEAGRRIATQGLSVRETERLVRKLLDEAQTPAAPRPEKDPNIRRLEDDLGSRLGARVAVHYDGKGKGQLTISYNSLDELDGILARIK